MKTQIKNQIKNSGKTRSQRRGTYKNPNIYEMGRDNGNYLPTTPFVKGGFRVNHPSIKLLKEWEEVDKDPSKNEGEWLMETFNNMNQVICFISLKKVCFKHTVHGRKGLPKARLPTSGESLRIK